MLGTVRPDGAPHVVPVVFAMAEARDVAYTAVDGKPKSGRRLQRLANIEHHPAVSLLVQHYDDDWSQLWWVRADGVAGLHDGDDAGATGLAALRRKYRQYHDVELGGPVIAVRITRWVGWPD
ncbi:TIGR03668 family PPOX class F420-dependent oxidoreductase [Mycolicibacterium duvalii]|nr:TIGR03668 family PPOX class F420-dependent oxidoreductase [Mycolicibacterium duvalii]